MIKEVLDQAFHWQFPVALTGIDNSSLPIKLETSKLILGDDFSDGARDPKWLVPFTAGPLAQFNSISPFPRRFTYTAERFATAQTFTLSQAATLRKFALRLRMGFTPAGSVFIEIRSAQFGGSPGRFFPSNTVLATTGGIAATAMPQTSGSSDATLQEFTLPTPLNLQPGVYAVVCRISGVVDNFNASYAEIWGEGNSDLYGGGEAWLGGLSPITGQFSWEPFSVLGAGGLQFTIFDFYFSAVGDVPSAEPVETGGFLQYDYPSDFGPKDLGTVLNQALGGISAEFRFIWNSINPNGLEALDYTVQILEGAINLPPTDGDRANKTLVELRIQPSSLTGNMKLWAMVTLPDGSRHAFHSGGIGWAGFVGTLPFVVSNANGVPITCIIKEIAPGPQGLRRITMTVFKNDDFNQNVFTTTASPQIRSLGGSVHLGIGNKVGLFGSRIRYDFFNVDGFVATEPPSGEIVLRKFYPFHMRFETFRLQRTLPAAGSKIEVRMRTADSLGALNALPFSAALPTTVSGNIETGSIEQEFGFFFDIKLTFIRGSPGPTLDFLDFTLLPEFVAQDLPIILSLDEAGPGRVRVTSSEEGPTENANTRKAVDGDTGSQWVSPTALDVNQVNLRLQFLDAGSNPELRIVNAVILRNTNVKRLLVVSNNLIFFDGELTGPDAIIPLPPQLTSAVDLVTETTQVPNSNKRMGEVYIGQALLALPGFESYDPGSQLFESGSMRTLGAKLISFRGKSKYRSRWRSTLIDLFTAVFIEQIFKDRPLVTFWPEPGLRPRDLFDVGWKMEMLGAPYTDVLKGAGKTIEVEVEEI